MVMKQCPECNADNPPGAKYCNACGAKIRKIRKSTKAIKYPEPEFVPLATLEQLQFRFTWRAYQQRVLDAVDKHLKDDKIHIVAAPGSGKTTLGIEMFRRLGRRALVLSPTRTIRNQWISRLRHFTTKPTDSWTSTELDHLSDFNSVTYQAVHTRYKEKHNDTEAAETDEVINEPLDDAPSDAEIDDLVSHIHRHHIGTIILDEAHHLRSEWWKALTRILELLPYIKLVSLTATPPYDVTGHEWRKYQALCGAIDEEITVPELVRSGTLAPHQDFVWSVCPFKTERDHVAQYAQDVKQVCDELFTSEELLLVINNHLFVTACQTEVDTLLDNSDLVVAILVYLKAKAKPLPEHLMQIMDLQPEDIPELTRQWWQTLIKAFLFDKNWQVDHAGEQYRKELKHNLRARHLLWRRELRLNESRQVKSKLTLSSAKIQACVDIHTLEWAKRDTALRQVILTDFIRDEYRPDEGSPVLGAWPVYASLLSQVADGPNMALITGRLSIIQQQQLPALQRAYGEKLLTTKPVADFPGYIQIVESGSNIVAAFTRIFMNGDIHVLVGSRSLLGEGWDAPCINSLVLASFVGSYMLTNQMRGRAIRVDPNNPDKVAGIWHIVAIAPDYWAGLVDLEELGARFNTFVGLSETEPVILNGLSRLALPYLDQSNNFHSKSMNISVSNRIMRRRLKRLPEVAGRWREAIVTGESQIVVPTLSIPKPLSLSPLHLINTLEWFVVQALLTLFTVLEFAVDSIEPIVRIADPVMLKLMAFVFVFACLYTGAKAIQALRLWILHLPVDGSVRQIGIVLRDSLIETGILEGPIARIPVHTSKASDGSVFAWLGGGSFQEQSLFSDALQELLGPIENPRYIIMRYKKRESKLLRSIDFHAVPQLLGAKKARAETFAKHWEKHIGPTKLLYMRDWEGRRLLLKVRSRAFANAAAKEMKRVDRWA